MGLARAPGHDDLCKITDGLEAVYVDNFVLAGKPHARGRVLAATSRAPKLKEKPRRIDRLLDITLSLLSRKGASSLESCGHPRRATPAVKTKFENDHPGEHSNDCRSFVGALMCVS